MKNRIEKESKPKTVKITLQLLDYEFEELKQMADYLGTEPHKVAEALLAGQVEDYMGREGDDIWSNVVDYICERYGDSPRLQLLRRYLAACEANGKLPSMPERRVLFDGPLDTAKNYVAYLRKIGSTSLDVDMIGLRGAV